MNYIIFLAMESCMPTSIIPALCVIQVESSNSALLMLVFRYGKFVHLMIRSHIVDS